MPETANGIYYETSGSDDGDPIVLISGYSAQLISWHPALCQMLVEEGLRVILLDNRDVGLSRKYGGPGDDDGGYGLDDMAGDVAEVLDELGIQSAHIAGQSMGGMIAQRFAAVHADRMKTLTLIYTTPWMSRYRGPDSALADTATLDRDGAVAMGLQRARVAASPGYPFDEQRILELAAAAYDRCYAPDGWGRQATAIATSFRGDQTAALREVTVPTLIIHGRNDPYFAPEAALAMAEAVPHSEVLILAGMGHDLPPLLFRTFVDAILRAVHRAG